MVWAFVARQFPACPCWTEATTIRWPKPAPYNESPGARLFQPSKRSDDMTPRASLLAAWLASCLVASTVAAQASGESAPAVDELRPNEALLMLDYQVIKVPGDAPIDLMGFHLYGKVMEGVYLGAGAYAPHIKGEYGGFMAFDGGVHLQHKLTDAWMVTAGLTGGGGGGGRGYAHSKLLSGTGGFFRASLGVAYDLGPFAIGVSATRMKFSQSLINSTQSNVFVSVPYTYLTGTYQRHGQTLSAADDRQASSDMGENMLTVGLDNFRQIDPQGSNQGTIRTADLQFSHFFAQDTYWFGSLGVGYSGLPIYNQMLGGIGHRMRLSQSVSLYGQVGVGSGGYAPEVIDTGPGLLVYPKVALEYAITPTLGLSVSAGYLSAPKGTSRNQTYGVALTQHLHSGGGGDAGSMGAPATWRGFRIGLFQQSEFNLRFDDRDVDRLKLVGVQVDTPLGGNWYLPVQAAVAYSDYLGYPGYGELLAGLGLQTRTEPGSRVQFFGQLMGGANVHGLGAKASAGVRYLLNDQLAVHLAVGHIATRDSEGRRFSGDSLGIGLDYRFAVPIR